MNRSEGQYRVDFDIQGFENLLLQNKYVCNLERALYCPCRTENNSSPSDNCATCKGTGWLFTIPVKVNGTLMSLNRDEKLRWNYPEIAATANFTLSEETEYRLAYFDKITLLEGNGITINNIVTVKKLKNKFNKDTFQISLPYIIKSIEFITIYVSKFEVKQLSDNDYKITESNIIEFSDSIKEYLIKNAPEKTSASIRYNHLPIYHVLSASHNIRMTNLVDYPDKNVKLPLQYLIRENSFFNQYGEVIT